MDEQVVTVKLSVTVRMTEEDRNVAGVLVKSILEEHPAVKGAYFTPADAALIERARQLYEAVGIEIDGDAIISEAAYGNWVQGWLWVPEVSKSDG
jgi:hypothetical protein